MNWTDVKFRALNRFHNENSISYLAVYDNRTATVAELKAEKAILNQILVSHAPPPPPAPTGKPKLYFVSMFEPFYDCSYAWELLVCACVLFLFICLNNLIV